ncbi:sulfotransferase family protein [Parvularcula oceani]|uniref:sulfotransferase family protein n=1 Tax=Parvularcula oceani TaxID=1247963 RepID=UPI000689DDDA|nr:sulfotransferase [Parvularcula oceani]
MSAKIQPDFIIIGAIKAATTWSARALRANPRVFMPAPEPHFFSTEYERGADWYGSLFAEAPEGAVVGEKSADYLSHPDAAARIAGMLPEARLIVQLRDPVARAYSDYCMLFRRGTVTAPPRELLRPGSAYADRFLSGGYYADHLARFYDRFAADRIEVVLMEDVERAPAAVIRALSRHVGVPPVIEAPLLESRANDSQAPLLPLGLRRTLAPLKPLAAPLRDSPWFERARRSMARPPDYPPLDAATRLYLEDLYAADIARLEGMIGRSLGAWRRNCRASERRRGTALPAAPALT